jgi:HAD superfamily phosphoserine phosphatase-like hydrolase
MGKLVVFDFDGTLSYKDSMKELFKEQMIGYKKFFLLYYFVLKVLAKLKITTVKFEKEQMLKLLFNSNLTKFKIASKNQATSFKLNPIFNKVDNHVKSGDQVIILSASSMYFLEDIFKDLNVKLLGTTIKSDGNFIRGIDRHPFYVEKVKCLQSIGITHVDEMYYDSEWDECLIPMCNEWHKVKDGVIVYNGKIN